MKSLFGMCFNWKVLAGLAMVAVGVFVIAPGLVIAALPVLFLAACPLSMMLMMRGGHGHAQSHDHAVDGLRERAKTTESLEQRLVAVREEQRRLELELRTREQELASAGDSDFRTNRTSVRG